VATASKSDRTEPGSGVPGDYFRFHAPHQHLGLFFGENWFARKAEKFARFFGPPVFLISQTLVVLVWIGLNLFVFTRFDAYPFILLEQNTRLTELVKELSISIETLTMDVHSKVVLERNV